MKKQKITITLPTTIYHTLRHQAKSNNLSLPEFIEKRIKLAPANPSLAKLPLNQLLKATTPKNLHPQDRLDFYQ